MFKTLGHFLQCIKKTYLYNFDPLKPHFYTVKVGFTGVYRMFLISAQNINCGYLLEPPQRGGSNEYQQSMFWAEIWKISEFWSENFHFFLVVKFSIYLNRRVFVMAFNVLDLINMEILILDLRWVCNVVWNFIVVFHILLSFILYSVMFILFRPFLTKTLKTFFFYFEMFSYFFTSKEEMVLLYMYINIDENDLQG